MKLLCVLLMCVAAVRAMTDLTGHRLISVQANSSEQVEFLHRLEENVELQKPRIFVAICVGTPAEVDRYGDTNSRLDKLDFWTDPSLVRPTDIHVPPESYSRLRRALKKAKIHFQVTKENIQELVDEETRSMKEGRKARGFHSVYHSYDEIFDYVYGMQDQYPHRVKVRVYGTTHENRPLLEVKIASDLSDWPKPAIYVEIGTHAREWITVSTGLMLIETLASGIADGKAMLEKYDWFITPSHNPDGYEYSRTKYRLWRKNTYPEVEERKNFWGSIYRCGGVDLNRNWEANYGGSGTSSDYCSDLYKGAGAFSEKETDALRTAVEKVREEQGVAAFFSMHCYSQYMLLPYAFQKAHPNDYDELKCVADRMMDALEAENGRQFVVGTPPDILYTASGGAYDYFKLNGIKYSYTYELRPASGTNNGFVLPASEIEPAARETIASLKAFTQMDLSECA